MNSTITMNSIAIAIAISRSFTSLFMLFINARKLDSVACLPQCNPLHIFIGKSIILPPLFTTNFMQ